jgi:YfiH family protein
MALQSELLNKIAGVSHGFGILDEPVVPALAHDWSSLPKWRQVHGTSLANVTTPLQECGDVDALYTSRSKIPVGVITADCVPILMAQKEGKGVAAIHAGWRGTKALIVQKVWEELKNLGHSPNEWVAVVGPSIGPCCYQVSEELAFDFLREFETFGKEAVVPSHRMLDLPFVNFKILKAQGLQEVELLRYCTKCSLSPQFHSYRRSQGKSPGRQLSGLVIK